MDSIKFCAEERALRAKEYFNKGYNCAQSVALAYADITSLSEEMVAKITASFGGGMGRLREVCGAVSGMSFVASFVSPCPTADNTEAKKANYALVQQVAEDFRQENGSIICRELLGLTCKKDDPTPSARTEEYYRRRPCVEYVATAARIVGEKINELEEK